MYKLYLIKRVVYPTILICLTLTGLAWLTQSLKFIDYIVNRGLDVSTFFYLSSLLLPSLFWIIIPVSLYISIIYSFNKLSSDSEFIIFKASGFSNFQIMQPIIAVAVFFMIVSYCISTYFLPKSYRILKDLKSEIKHSYITLLIEKGVFTSPTDGITVYVREEDSNGLYRGIILHDSRNKEKSIIMMAEKGELIDTDNVPKFVLYDGNRQEVNLNEKKLSLLYFERYVFELDILKENAVKKRKRQPEEKFLHELFMKKKLSEGISKKSIAEFNAEAHHRLTWPIYNIILCMLAAIPFFHSKFRRTGIAKQIITNVIFCILVVLSSFMLKNFLVKNENLWPITYVILSIILITISYLLFFRDRRKTSKVI